jgi:xylulokinase
MPLLGLDIGTTGCKAAVFDEKGHLLSTATQEYGIDIPHPGWAEQDAERVWTLAQEAMGDAIVQAGRPAVAAIGLSVQGEAVIPVDGSGRALRPAILGMDTRTGEQNEWLEAKFGAERLFQMTGMPVHTINTLPKLLWLKAHEPYVWQTAHRFLLYEDFLINKMTGQPVISRCLASRTQVFDLRADEWSAEILQAIDLDPARLSIVRPSGFAVGEMIPALVANLGLSRAPIVVTGGHDQACGALGVGLVRPGLAMVSTGTAEVVEVALPEPALNDALYAGNLSCYAHVVPNMYLAMTLNHSGGLLLRWFRDTFCEEERRQANAQEADAYDLILKDSTAEPTGLMLLPHFAGSGTPTFDTGAKGAILGLTFGTKKADIAKAILEGLTFELRMNLDVLRAGGVEISELRAIGGGARSKLWLQLKSDITGVRVIVPQITEAASWGAAVLAGVGAGVFHDAASAVQSTLQLDHAFEPDPSRRATYQTRYEIYRQLYPALKTILHSL